MKDYSDRIDEMLSFLDRQVENFNTSGSMNYQHVNHGE